MDFLGTFLFTLSACLILTYGMAIFSDALVESKRALRWISSSCLVSILVCIIFPTTTLLVFILGPGSISLFIYSRTRENLSKSRNFYLLGCTLAFVGLLGMAF